MPIYKGPRVIRRGDEVIITDGAGNTERGIVESANDFGSHNQKDWHIEMRNAKGEPCFWRQSIDGGTVEIKYIGELR